MPTTYAAIGRQIAEDDPAYKEGFCWSIEQVDGDIHKFRTRYRYDEFIETHNIELVSENSMEEIREYIEEHPDPDFTD